MESFFYRVTYRLGHISIGLYFGRLIFHFSPPGGSPNVSGGIIEENLEVINKFNREAKINPDNSILVEVSLTAEQFELVKSGRYIVSLCDTMAMELVDPKLNLTNWKAKPVRRVTHQKVKKKKRSQRR